MLLNKMYSKKLLKFFKMNKSLLLIQETIKGMKEQQALSLLKFKSESLKNN